MNVIYIIILNGIGLIYPINKCNIYYNILIGIGLMYPINEM